MELDHRGTFVEDKLKTFDDSNVVRAAISAERAWGRSVGVSTVGGHSSRVYIDRRHAVSEVLVDLARWGTRTAIIQGSNRISDQDCVSLVDHVAGYLRSIGVRPGDRILLAGANSLNWVLAFLAVEQLGAIVVPGNTWWTGAEIAHAIKLTNPAIAIADHRQRLALPDDVTTVQLEDIVRLAELSKAHPSNVHISEDDPALILFTSGTTGEAKGVVLTHRSVIANLHSLLLRTNRLPSELGEDHRGTVSLMCLPLFHIGGLQSLLAALLSGGTVIFPEERFDSRNVLKLLEQERVTFWGAVPTMVSRVLDDPEFEEYDLSSLSSVTMGGASVSPELLERVRSKLPNVVHGASTIYGLTEAGGLLTAGAGQEVASHPGYVGNPLPVVELRIGDPGADGVGEILARSPAVMAGYWGEAECSSVLSDEGWLRTGDLGWLDENGSLYVVGRTKDIIIRGGENISSAAVESCLADHPGVSEVAVVGLPHPDLGEEVGAAVVPRTGWTLRADDLRQHMTDRIARFAVPTRWWIRSEALPVNATGKVTKFRILDTWMDSPN